MPRPLEADVLQGEGTVVSNGYSVFRLYVVSAFRRTGKAG